MTPGGPLLAIDTATTHAVIALGTPAGDLVAARTWTAGYRHGEELLIQVEGLLRDAGLAPGDLGGLVAGTGPGAFTGLRVGLATVKGLAYALDLPVAGVATRDALLSAVMHQAGRGPAAPAAETMATPAPTYVLLQPAGPSDRVVSRPGEPSSILAGGSELELRSGERLVAVDLEGRAAPDASALGEVARVGLAVALLALGAATLAAGHADDLAALAPEYVTLPRGVRAVPGTGGVELTGGSGGSGASHPAVLGDAGPRAEAR